MNLKFHFKYEPKRGLCMTQAGGKAHFPLTSFVRFTGDEVARCLNECYNEWQRSRFSKEAQELIAEVEKEV